MSYEISRKTKINDKSESTSPSTGALIVSGGVGVDGDIFLEGCVGILNDSSSVKIKTHKESDSYNFNLPLTPGANGEILISNGGGHLPMSWAGVSGSGRVIMSSGPVFDVGGITSVAGTSTFGKTIVNDLHGTRAIFGSTFEVSGLSTFGNGGIKSISGINRLGETIIDTIVCNNSARFSSSIKVEGLSSFGSITSTSGTVTLGRTIVGDISGINATFDSEIHSKGLATFGCLKVTSGPTVLGETTVGILKCLSAKFSSSVDICGTATFGTGGISNTSGPSILGKTSVIDIDGRSGAFTQGLSSDGLASFGSMAVSGDSTLGKTKIGAITGYRASFSSDVSSSSKSTGAVTVLGGISTQENLNVGGHIGIYGNGSGNVRIKVQNSSGDYNFNLPTTAGENGQVLTSSGGDGSAMTWKSKTNGSVTSVGVSLPSFLEMTGAPISSSGNIQIKYSDIPLPIENGGTGARSLNMNSILIGSSSGSIQSPSSLTYSGSILQTPKMKSTDSTPSSSPTTGSLLVQGGVGISNTTDSSSHSNGGSLTIAGGAAIAKSMHVGLKLIVGENNRDVLGEIDVLLSEINTLKSIIAGLQQ